MSKHTAGPWSIGDESIGTIDIKHHNNAPGAISLVLARVTARNSWISESQANARLIASAPELLEALEKFADCENAAKNGDDVIGRNLLSEFRVLARNAIAKARGEQA